MALRPGRALAFSVLLLLPLVAILACSDGNRQGSEGHVSKATIERGAALYEANCLTCHVGPTGGSLRDIPPPHNANGHTWHHADQQIIDVILNGFSFSLEEQKMPPFKDTLTEEEAKAILAYIKTWWTKEQREWQATVTANWSEMNLSGASSETK